MEKLSDLLFEAVSPLLYHVTDLGRAVNILKEDKFRLTPAFGTGSDMEKQKGKLYFLSTSRIKYGGYTRSLSDEGYVNMELDGRKLGHNYQSVNVDYWGGDFRDVAWQKGDMQQFLRYDENEERIITNDAEIKPATKYIKSLHVIMGEDVKERKKKKYKKLEKLAKKKSVDIHFYTNPKYWKKQWEEKADNSVSEIFGEIEGEYEDLGPPKVYGIPTYIKGAVEIIKADNPKELSEDGQEMFEKLKNGTLHNFENVFKNKIHNNKSNPKVLDDIKFLARKMKKEGKNSISGLIEILSQEAKELQKQNLNGLKRKYINLVKAILDFYSIKDKPEPSVESLNKKGHLDAIVKHFPFDKGKPKEWDNQKTNKALEAVNDLERLLSVGYFDRLQKILGKENREHDLLNFIYEVIQPVVRRVIDYLQHEA